MTDTSSRSDRPDSFEDRFRLYIDESGDHVIHEFKEAQHRYLCLLGCWIQGKSYTELHDAMERFKRKHIPHNPDEPVTLHREDIVNRRSVYWRLKDNRRRDAFDSDLLDLIADLNFRLVGVVIDKKALTENYEAPSHPYHLGMGFMLQRYCGYLNHVNRTGDVMAESRGGKEDRMLMDSFERVYERGAWKIGAEFFQQALTTRKLKVKQKSANIAGLQLADLLAHPVRQYILEQNNRLDVSISNFARRVIEIVEPKFNRHLYDGRVEGYGTVLFPKK